MLVPEGSTSFKDLIHGEVTFKNSTLDDQIIMKSDGFPTYHFANVVDDYTMQISHVIRGMEWLPSTPKHILLHKMLDIEPPLYCHLPLIVDMDGKKLSKRNSAMDMSVASFREKGYLPEGLLNSVALLGWSPPSHSDP
jgi:nondiscriminating glutamyl-tRNA synthetase